MTRISRIGEAQPANASRVLLETNAPSRVRTLFEAEGYTCCMDAHLAIELRSMHNEFTAIIERDGDWFMAQCPEVPEANGQGRTPDEAKLDLAAAIRLVLEDRREDALKAASSDALRDVVTVGS
jgi:predicted RNase H-like HicB family nuclease